MSFIRRPKYIEAVPCGQELIVVTEMPLAVNGGGVAFCLQHLRDIGLALVNPVLARRPEGAEDADAIRIAAGQQRRPRRRADGLRHVEVREPYPLRCNAIDVGGANHFVAEAADIAVAQVVGEHDDDIRRPIGGERDDWSTQSKKCDSRHGAIQWVLSSATVSSATRWLSQPISSKVECTLLDRLAFARYDMLMSHRPV
jgi:hypothetical protein